MSKWLESETAMFGRNKNNRPSVCQQLTQQELVNSQADLEGKIKILNGQIERYEEIVSRSEKRISEFKQQTQPLEERLKQVNYEITRRWKGGQSEDR